MTSTAPYEQLVDAVVTAWNTKNPERFGEIFPEDAEWTDVIGQTWHGPDGIADGHREPFGRLFAAATLSYSAVRGRQVSDDVASIDATWQMTGHVSPEGEALPPREGLLHIVAIRRSGQWLPLVTHNADYTRTYRRTETGGSPLA